MKRFFFAICALALAASALGMAAVTHQNAVQAFGVTAGCPRHPWTSVRARSSVST